MNTYKIMKRGLMFVVLIVLLSFLVVAVDQVIYCYDDVDCDTILGMGYYCSFDLGNIGYGRCLVSGALASSIGSDTSLLPSQENSIYNQNIPVNSTGYIPSAVVIPTANPFSSNLELVKSDVNVLKSSVNQIESNLETLSGELTGLQQQINELSSTLGQSEQKINTIATGMAGLQQDIQTTQENLTAVKGELAQEKSFSIFLKVFLFILLAAGVAFLFAYFMTGSKRQKKLTPQISTYISHHIRLGNPYNLVKEHLSKAGWKEGDIQWAYRETVKRNYQNYVQQNSIGKNNQKIKTLQSFQKQKPFKDYDAKKIMVIVVVSLILMISVGLILNGTVGKAFYVSKLINTQTSEVTYAVECTPPHILTPEGDSCCLDLDNNFVCDNIDQRLIEENGIGCNDNNQCQNGEYCINSECLTLSSLSPVDGCAKQCTTYALKVKALYPVGTEQKVRRTCVSNLDCNDDFSETKDICSFDDEGSYCLHTPLIEVYNLKPNQGSYFAAGGIEWKILNVPNFCKGSSPVVPIKITKKRTGEIIQENVIVLKENEISSTLTHPDLPEPFNLELDQVFYSCPE